MSGALDGLVALDLATFVAAPFCCTLLGELGAEVIKIEQPGSGSRERTSPPWRGRASCEPRTRAGLSASTMVISVPGR
jgi:crotonobetainyl-CoA:carnitine CoA-transferase CaiB-like acyl-CoA transferase